MLLTYSFLTSFVLTLVSIPSIISIVTTKYLFDSSEKTRKNHNSDTPTFGGLAIFVALIFSVTFWSNQQEIVELQYIISALMIIFIIGLKDDIAHLVAWKKLFGQVIAAIILVHYAKIRLITMYGLFGILDIPLWFSYILSIFTIVVITNAFNLIDGIDTLAGAIGLIVCITFGSWFYSYGETQYAILSFSLAGALLGFLKYNFSPAQIFMGDTGALIVGMVASILAIKFIELNRVLPIGHPNKVQAVPVVTISILIVPLFDTLRVFVIRMLNKRSPFSPDRNHIHYMLVDSGMSHLKASMMMCLINILLIIFSFAFQWLRGELLLFLLILISIFFIFLIKKLNGRNNVSYDEQGRLN